MDWKKILGELFTPELETLLKGATNNWIPQERMNDAIGKKNEKIASLETELTTRDTQIVELEKVAGTSTELQAKLDEMKTANELNKKAFEKYKADDKIKAILKKDIHPNYVDLIFKELNRDEIVVKGDEIIGLSNQLVALKEKYSEVVKKSDGEGYGSGNGKDDPDKAVKNPWLKESYNLTEQGRLLQKDRATALRLRKEALGI